MLTIEPEQARTLAAISALGSFDAAAEQLHVTPSAVSQRIRALEGAVGRPVLRRGRPVTLTESGASVVRFARQVDLLTADLVAELDPTSTRGTPELTLVINSDSLHTWALPALVSVADQVQLEVLREDQAHSLDLLRSGTAAAAITATAAPVPGCTSHRLGTMRYLPVCAPSFAARWFGTGVTAASLAAAPVLVFDRKDDLQDRYLRRHRVRHGVAPRHHVPAAGEFAEAVRLGLGWGMLPEIEIAEQLREARLRVLAPEDFVDVGLHWQQWRLSSSALESVATAIRTAASALRSPP